MTMMYATIHYKKDVSKGFINGDTVVKYIIIKWLQHRNSQKLCGVGNFLIP